MGFADRVVGGSRNGTDSPIPSPTPTEIGNELSRCVGVCRITGGVAAHHTEWGTPRIIWIDSTILSTGGSAVSDGPVQLLPKARVSKTVVLMKHALVRGLILSFALAALNLALSGVQATEPSAGKIRLLVLHGGHDFETNQFWQIFRDNPSVTFQTMQYPEAERAFDAAQAKEYDVLVFYDMWQTISDQSKTNLLNRLSEGKGLIAMHHCLASFQNWDEYARIIGGRYHLKKWTDQGVEKPGSTYLHDVDFKVRIADAAHPINRGLANFDIHDETYSGFEVRPESHVLLTTDAPTSGRDIAWSKTYGAARVVYLQLGHDHRAYENPNYRKFVAQAIQWVAHQPR